MNKRKAIKTRGETNSSATAAVSLRGVEGKDTEACANALHFVLMSACCREQLHGWQLIVIRVDGVWIIVIRIADRWRRRQMRCLAVSACRCCPSLLFLRTYLLCELQMVSLSRRGAQRHAQRSAGFGEVDAFLTDE